MHSETKEQAIYLASANMGTVNFQEIIEDPNENYTQKIDLDNFSSLFLLNLLTSPRDAKPNNFVVNYVQNQKGDNSIHLISIDNDMSFCKGNLGIKKLSGKTKIYSDMLNILYFLPQMDQVISRNLVEQLTENKGKVIEFLSYWLKEMHLQNSRYKFLSGTNFTPQDLKDMNLPIKLKKGTLVKIYHKLDSIVKILNENPYITHSNILKKIYPSISYFYERTRKENSNDPLQSIKQAYTAATDSEELTNQLKNLDTEDDEWSEVSNLQTIRQKDFSITFDNEIENEAEEFIAAIDFSAFTITDNALLTLIRNNLFFVKNLKLHNISFDQLRELVMPERAKDQKIKNFQNIQKITLVNAKSKTKAALINLLSEMGVKFEILYQENINIYPEIVEKLKLLNANDATKINTQDENGDTDLHKAVMSNNKIKVQQLLDLGINDQLKNKLGQTAIDLSQADDEKIEIYQMLLDYKPKTFWTAINAGAVYEATQLAQSVSLNRLEQPVESNVIKDMNTPIYLALENEHLTDLAYILIKRGVNFSKKDIYDNNILHLISYNYSKDSAVNLIHNIITKCKTIKISLDEKNKNGFYPADIVAQQGKSNMLVAYINEGYKFSTYDHTHNLDYNINLEICSLAGRHGIKIEKNDIEKGFDFSKCNEKNQNILHICSQEMNWPLFEKLMNTKLPPKLGYLLTEEKNLWGENEEYKQFANEKTIKLAMLYHKYGFKISLEELITGFNCEKVNDYGNNLIYEIIKTIEQTYKDQIQKYEDLESALQHTNQIDVNYTARENGRTALHFAASARQGEALIQLLLEYGADKKIQDKFGNIPYDLDNINLLKPESNSIRTLLLSERALTIEHSHDCMSHSTFMGSNHKNNETDLMGNSVFAES